jgi:short-subunit dehydrogenase
VGRLALTGNAACRRAVITIERRKIMRVSLKPLSQQTVVITGATSGIGLVTARMAAQRGAALVLAARNEQALQQLTEELTHDGARAIFVGADVGDESQVRRIAQAALDHFGGFDTWINNAGISIFGRSEDVSLADGRRLFDTNFWGVVHGSRVAVEHLKRRGGALINVGSEVSDVAVPLQGLYSASKHAVKGSPMRCASSSSTSARRCR